MTVDREKVTDTQEEVKPCPFCGNTPLGSDGKPQFLAHQGTKWGSLVCCCLGPEVRTDYKDESHWGPDAIEEWNKRPIEEALRARVEELVQLNHQLIMLLEGHGIEFPEETKALLNK